MDPISIIGAVAGIGLGLWSSNKQAKQQRDMYNQQMSALQSINSNQQATMPELPTAPNAPETNPDAPKNDEAEAEREKALRASAANNQRVNPTRGLGLTSLPNMKKPTLGGA